MLPIVPRSRALARVDAIWGPDGAPHHFVFGQTGSGKTTLIKSILDLCPKSRTLTLDPKPHADAVWDGPTDDPNRYGLPITQLQPRFGFQTEEGGGPWNMRYRLTGSPDRADTARRFGKALEIIAAEGNCILVLDDVRETCRQLRLTEHVDSVMNLGRSANVLVILGATETSYVSGRAQAGMLWIGATTGLDAAKAGAAMLGKSGRAWYEITGSVEPHQWIYSDSQPGNAGPVLIAEPAA